MVSKKQRFKTVVLVLVFALAIIGGVFGISYYKGILTFPWQVTEASVASKEVAQQPETAQTEEVTTTEQVKEEPAEEATKEEVVKEEKPEKKDKSETAKTEDAEDEVSEESQETSEEDADSNVATTGNTLDYYGALHVEDGSLVDEAGDAVQLTGVSSHGLSWYPEYVTAESIKSLRETLGINVIRLAVYTSDYNGYCVGGEEIQSVIKDNIDEAVKAATASDMYVILDWHILNDGDPNEYKSEAIEICNEPNGDTTWADIKKYAKEVIPVIRNVNKDALILVGTPEWSSDLDSVLEDPLDFDNIMYTYHFYAGSHKASARNTLTNALESGLPVFISEYGFTAADGDGAIDKKEAAKWLEIIDEFKLSSCIWNLSNKDEGSALIANDCDKTSDFEYEDFSEQGKYFFDILKETNGNDNQRED